MPVWPNRASVLLNRVSVSSKRRLTLSKKDLYRHQTEPLFEPNRASVYVWFYYLYSLCGYVSTLIILVQDRFLNLTIWKPSAQAFQKTLTFDWYLFNSRGNFHVNLVHWNSLHPKNAILLTFLGQTPHFLCENHKTRTNNLHHWIAGSAAYGWGSNIYKKWFNNYYNAVAVECTLYLARPLK